MVEEPLATAEWSMDLETLRSLRKNILDPLDTMSLRCRMPNGTLQNFRAYCGYLIGFYNSIFSVLQGDEIKIIDAIELVQSDIIDCSNKGKTLSRHSTASKLDVLFRELSKAMKDHGIVFKTNEYVTSEEKLRGDLGLKKKAKK